MFTPGILGDLALCGIHFFIFQIFDEDVVFKFFFHIK